jgi:protein-S-isoprenylcysteine O-methyltransferase Ste14
MKVESVAMVLFAAWYLSEAGILRTARDRSGADADHRSLLMLVASNMVLPGLSIVLYVFGITLPTFPPWLMDIGIAMMVTGFSIRWSGMWTLRKFFSANVAVQADHRLVIRGPYRFVRHPGYFGGWLAFVGLGLALGNGVALILLAVFTIPAFLYRIGVEENALNSAFPEYAAYRVRVRRFFPFVW